METQGEAIGEDEEGLGDPRRMAVLDRVMDLRSEIADEFDRMAELASRALGAPVAQINFVLPQAQVSLSSVGPDDWSGPREVDLDASFCQHIVREGHALLVEDAPQDPRVAENRATVEAGVVSYAGMPLRVDSSLVLGSLCVVDFQPRIWTSKDMGLLREVADFVERELRRRLSSASDVLLLASLVETAPHPIASTSLAGTVQSWNGAAADLFGYTTEEALGMDVRTLVPESFESVAREALVRAAGGSTVRGEAPLLAASGQEIPALVSAAPIPDVTGATVGIGLMAEDLREQKQAREALRASDAKLQQAQKMEAIGRLAGGVAHDFNNILAVINGNVQLALLDLPDASDTRELLQEVDQASTRARDLVRQLLTFSRQQDTSPQKISLVEALENTRRILERIIGGDVAVEWDMRGDFTVFVDPVELGQVIMNLAVNARDAMPGGGTFSVECEELRISDGGDARFPALPPGGYALLSVADTGEGIPPEVQERIFDPFFTTKEEGKGTGLGLSTVYGIVTKAGGSLNVRSELGVGTRFHIALPIVADSPLGERERPTAQTRDDRAAAGSETVLLVEDDPAVRSVAKRILERSGYVVTVASDGSEAWESLSRDPEGVDLVLTDVSMPRMDGIELTRRIRRLPNPLPVILSSGRPEDAEGADDGLTAFLQKPYDPAGLSEIVRRTLDGPAGTPG